MPTLADEQLELRRVNPEWWWVRVPEESRKAIEHYNCHGEWAVREAFNQRINKMSRECYEEDPDNGTFIQVQTRKEQNPRHWEMLVNGRRLVDDRVYIGVLTCYYPEWIVIQGWVWGREIRAHNRVKQVKVGQSEPEEEFVYTHRLLKNPVFLFDVIRKRDPDNQGAHYRSPERS